MQVAEEAIEQLAEAQRQAAEAVDEAAQLRGRLATAQQQIKARLLFVPIGIFPHSLRQECGPFRDA